MGQRHQLYIIAKVGGRYRTLAAVHRQWGYGVAAFRRMKDVVEVLRANGSALRRDFLKAEKLDWQAVSALAESKDNAGRDEFSRLAREAELDELSTIFPFTTTCLVVGSGVDSELLPISHPPTRFGNNDGITVFDVADPDQPRYAFVSLPCSEHDEEVERMVPMNAAEYVDIYRQEGESRQETPHTEKLLQSVASFPLIDAEALISAWPELHFEDRDRHAEQKPVGGIENTPTASSLRGITMRQLVLKGLESDQNDLSWLEEAMQLPDFTRSLRDMLYAQPELTEKPSGLILLKHSMQDEGTVDLIPFPGLTLPKVLAVIQDKSQKVILSLPDMADLEIQGLNTLLDTKTLRELHLGETPGLTLQEALDAMSGRPLQAFTHPTMYKMPLELKYYSWADSQPEHFPSYPVGVAAGFPVSQLIFIQQNAEFTKPEYHLDDGEGLAWSRTVAAETTGTGPSRMSGEETLAVVPFQLKDCLLTLDRLLEQLPGAVGHFAANGPWDLNMSHEQTKAAEGMALRQLAQRPDHRLLPIPQRSLDERKRNLFRRCPPKADHLRQGEWTLLALHEAWQDYKTSTWPVSRLRYCFVTLDHDGQVISLPVRKFVDSLLPNEIYRSDDEDTRRMLIETFEGRMDPGEEGQTTSISPCGRAEAEEAVRLIDIHRERRIQEDEKFKHIDAARRGTRV